MFTDVVYKIKIKNKKFKIWTSFKTELKEMLTAWSI